MFAARIEFFFIKTAAADKKLLNILKVCEEKKFNSNKAGKILSKAFLLHKFTAKHRKI